MGWLDLLAHRDNLVTDLESLLEMTQHSVSVYNDAARCFQENAAEEPFDEIKDYVTLANAWTAMASFMDMSEVHGLPSRMTRFARRLGHRTYRYLPRSTEAEPRQPSRPASTSRTRAVPRTIATVYPQFSRFWSRSANSMLPFNPTCAPPPFIRALRRPSHLGRSRQCRTRRRGMNPSSPPAVSPPTTTSESQRRPQSNQASLMYAFSPIFAVLFAMTIAAVPKKRNRSLSGADGDGLSFPTRFGVDSGSATPETAPCSAIPVIGR